MKKLVFGSLVVAVSLVLIAVFSHAEDKGYNFFQYQAITSTGVTNISWTNTVDEIEILRISTRTVPTIYIDWFDHRTSSTIATAHTTGAEMIDAYTIQTATIAPIYFNYHTSQTSVWVDSTTTGGCPVNIRVKGRGWKW